VPSLPLPGPSRKIRDWILALLASGRLPPDGIVARLAAHFGPNQEGVVDGVITLLCGSGGGMGRSALCAPFLHRPPAARSRSSPRRPPPLPPRRAPVAGHDTSSSSITSMIAALSAHPRVLRRLAAEQAAVVAALGPALSPAAIAAAPYATAVIRETLRYRPVVAGAMRTALRDIPLPGGESVPAGCPVVVAFSSMAAREPAWQADWDDFRPERFLAGGAGLAAGEGGAGPGRDALAPVPTTFVPFGVGTRYCMGSHLAHAEMAAVAFEVARLVEAGYALEVEQPKAWAEFPILRPTNRLPARLVPRGAAEDDDDYGP
jgi:hypothetical protein